METIAEWDHPRSIIGAQLLLALGSENGISQTEGLANTGIPPSLLNDSQAFIEARQELALVRNLLRAIAKPELGLYAGSRYHLTAFGIYGYALTSCASLGSALEFGIRFLELTHAFCNMQIEDSPETTRLVLNDQSIPEDVRQFAVECTTSAIMNFHRELMGVSAPLKRMTLQWPKPNDITPYINVFGIAPEFNAARNTLEMEPSLVNSPLPQANMYTEQSCEAQCRALLSKQRAIQGIAASVRERLLQQVMILPTMEEVADSLSMTTRTLRRKLQAEGTSFRALVDEVRETMADELLTNRKMSVDDIAIRLGYADTSSFIYAFKRWKGRTPRGRVSKPIRQRDTALIDQGG